MEHAHHVVHAASAFTTYTAMVISDDGLLMVVKY